jgi:methyl-accepting chemotaxis protein
MFSTIKAKMFAAFWALILVFIALIIIAYNISVHEVKQIMVNDIKSVANALEQNINYIANKEPEGWKSKEFQERIYATKVGKSGYVYMIDETGTMVVHHKKQGKNYAGHDYIDTVRTNQGGGVYEYVSATTQQHKIVAYRYIPQWGLWVIPGVNKADYFDAMQSKFILYFSIIGVLFGGAIFLGFKVIAINHLVRPIRKLEKESEEIAKDFAKRTTIVHDDEVGAIARIVNQLASAAHETFTRVQSNSDTLEVEQVQLKKNDTFTSAITHMMSENIASGIHDIQETMSESVDEIEGINSLNEQTGNIADTVSQKTSRVTHSLEEMTSMVKSSNEQSRTLNASMESIAAVINLIKDISDQTNLLALNAAVEAVRAGEAGRGFAVVADEVKKLSSNTQKATVEVEQKIANLKTQSMEILQQADETLAISQQASQDISSFKDGIQELVSNAESIKDGNRHLSHGLFVNMAKLDHIVFKLNGYSHVLEHSTSSSNISDHTNCRLGKWYYHGEGKQFLSHIPAFSKLEAPHARVHKKIKEAIETSSCMGLECKNYEKTIKLFEEAEQASQSVSHILNSLIKSSR